MEGSRSSLANGLLLIAGIISALAALIALAAAAWGMDTRLPWVLGIYMYLLPALTLPSFLLLLWIHVRYFARVLWLLTLGEPFAFYFGDKAERLSSGMKPLSDPGGSLRHVFQRIHTCDGGDLLACAVGSHLQEEG